LLSATLQGNTLLQNLHDPGRICDFWFANQEVEMLGHDHVSSYDELVFLAGLLENSQKNIAMPGGSEKRKSAIARTGVMKCQSP